MKAKQEEAWVENESLRAEVSSLQAKLSEQLEQDEEGVADIEEDYFARCRQAAYSDSVSD